MQKRLRGGFLVGALLLMAYMAYADTVTVSTFYPSPFGDYTTLNAATFTATASTLTNATVTNTFITNGATNLATAGGAVGIGTAAAADRTLQVVGETHIGDTANTGILIKGANTPVQYNWQLAESVNVPDAFEITPSSAAGGIIFNAPTVVVTQSGRVGINTGIVAPTTTLDVNGQIRVSDGVNSGVLQVSCAANKCYAVYS